MNIHLYSYVDTAVVMFSDLSYFIAILWRKETQSDFRNL
jgi:hypothetical protein